MVLRTGVVGAPALDLVSRTRLYLGVSSAVFSLSSERS